ncbi:hypothetical protein CHS0354_028053 [Potamilus streckersoni]|uniref:PKD domain-containing protein n=1 Tax=Potamilus streckersoni TaxID=2493646 RepID=A0AAE0TIM1_9BIVA|nr:hypothetical protein CHS0354_028053 [Potamilus streckersoni]
MEFLCHLRADLFLSSPLNAVVTVPWTHDKKDTGLYPTIGEDWVCILPLERTGSVSYNWNGLGLYPTIGTNWVCILQLERTGSVSYNWNRLGLYPTIGTDWVCILPLERTGSVSYHWRRLGLYPTIGTDWVCILPLEKAGSVSYNWNGLGLYPTIGEDWISNGQINFCTHVQNTLFHPNDYEIVLFLPCGHDTVQNVACDFDFGDGNITRYKWDVVTVLSTLTITHRYRHLGRYDVRVTCSPAFSERYSVLMDNPINELCSDPPTMIYYPPAKYPMNFWTPLNHIPIFNMSCMYRMGDDIDLSVHYKMHSSNLVIENALFNYNYLTLGPHNISVSCGTFDSSITVNKSVYVENRCFSTNGVFDRLYSQISSPLVLSTAIQYQASSRVNVYCNSSFPEYKWTLEIQENGFFQRINILSPIYRDLILPENFISPAFYRITCRMTFDESKDEYFEESTYVRFVSPPSRYQDSFSKIR